LAWNILGDIGLTHGIEISHRMVEYNKGNTRNSRRRNSIFWENSFTEIVLILMFTVQLLHVSMIEFTSVQVVRKAESISFFICLPTVGPDSSLLIENQYD
jgi:hypothetical protein